MIQSRLFDPRALAQFGSSATRRVRHIGHHELHPIETRLSIEWTDPQIAGASLLNRYDEIVGRQSEVEILKNVYCHGSFVRAG